MSAEIITNHGEMGCLAMLVMTAREERPLGKAMACPIAGSPARGRRDVSQCPWLLPGRSGHLGRPLPNYGTASQRPLGMSHRAGGLHSYAGARHRGIRL